MKEKTIILLCITLILCVAMICGTILLTHNNDKELQKNSANNNTTINSMINNTNSNNTTASMTSTKSSNKKTSSDSSSSSSSISTTPTGDNVPTRDSNGNRVFRDGDWVGTSEGGAHVYRDPRTGQLFDSRGNLPSNYKYDPR